MVIMATVKHALPVESSTLHGATSKLVLMETVADRIKQLRDHLKCDQPGLAKLMGVTKSAVWQWERGITEPSMKHLVKLQQKRRINPGWVLKGAKGGEMILPLTFAELTPRQKVLLELFDYLDETQQTEVIGELEDTKRRNEEIFEALKSKQERNTG